MQKILVALSLLLVGTLASQGQTESQSAFASNSNSSDSVIAGGQTTKPDYRPVDKPIGSVSENFVYMYSQGQSGANRSLIGWSVVPSLTPAHGFGLQSEFEGLYMRSVYPGQSWVIMTAGPRFTMALRKRFTPFIFGEAGEARIETPIQAQCRLGACGEGRIWASIAGDAAFRRHTGAGRVDGAASRLQRFLGPELHHADWHHVLSGGRQGAGLISRSEVSGASVLVAGCWKGGVCAVLPAFDGRRAAFAF